MNSIPESHGQRANADLTGEVRVLCVDDDELAVELTVDMLETQDAELSATGLTDPTDVLPALERETVDCVVSDYEMPEMTGLELLEAVREEFPELPFILFTGKGSEQIASDAIAAGVTEYLCKGSGTERYELLCNRIVNAVNRKREHRRRVRAEQWYYQLFDQRLIGVGLSQDQIYQEANELFAGMLGYDREEVIGMSVLDTIASYDHDRVRRAIDRREGGTVDRVRYTVDLHCRDGTTRTAEIIGGRVEYQGDPAILGLILPTAEAARRETPQFEPLIRRLGALEDALEPHAEDDAALAAAHTMATQVYDQLTTIAAADRDDEYVQVAVADVVREGWEQLDTPESATLEIDGGGEVWARRSGLAELVAQICDVAVDGVFTDVTVQCQPTDTGFALRVTSPQVASAGSGLLGDDHQPAPDPVTDVSWDRGTDVYIERVAEDSIRYELVFTRRPQ